MYHRSCSSTFNCWDLYLDEYQCNTPQAVSLITFTCALFCLSCFQLSLNIPSFLCGSNIFKYFGQMTSQLRQRLHLLPVKFSKIVTVHCIHYLIFFWVEHKIQSLRIML